jgi:hypothetical protein
MAYDIKKLVARKGITKRSLTNLENFLNEVDENNKDIDKICVKQEMLPDIWNAFVEVRDELEIEDEDHEKLYQKLSASYGILVMMSFNFKSRLRIFIVSHSQSTTCCQL